jgi:septal ring factor EnvC (AmiA/AmiB activator)
MTKRETTTTTNKIERELSVVVDGDELTKRNDELARLVEERDTIETEMAAYQSPKRKRLREIRKEQTRIAAEIRTRKGLALVNCEERFDWSTNTVRVVRLDTNEVVEERAATANERQTAFPIDTGEGKKKARGGRSPNVPLDPAPGVMASEAEPD